MLSTIVEAFQSPHQWGILGRVALAMALGAILGLERQLAAKPAGLRTHMLVSGSAALLVSLGQVVVEGFPEDVPRGVVRTDPLRIVEAVIQGVSFLGAGTILRRLRHQQIEGLTTAASLLLAAGIGLSVGLMQLLVALGTACLGVVVLQLIGRLDLEAEPKGSR